MSKVQQTLSWSLSQWLVNTKRRFFNWRGDGVHSPYAFHVIRQVIRNPHSYESYRHLYNKQQASEYRKVWGEGCIVDRSRLELIFRLVYSYAPQAYYLHADQGQNNTLLLSYIDATGYNNKAKCVEEADCLIVEDVSSFEVNEEFKIKPRENYIVLLNRRNPKVRKWIQYARRSLHPQIVFTMVGLEIWIWRPNTTPGYYPVYYK